MTNTNSILTGPVIQTNIDPHMTFDFIFSKTLAFAGIAGAFIYITFSILLFFRTKNLHKTLNTPQGELLVLLALANLIISIIIGILGFLIAVV